MSLEALHPWSALSDWEATRFGHDSSRHAGHGMARAINEPAGGRLSIAARVAVR